LIDLLILSLNQASARSERPLFRAFAGLEEVSLQEGAVFEGELPFRQRIAEAVPTMANASTRVAATIFQRPGS
jgi:hypothetical protein